MASSKEISEGEVREGVGAEKERGVEGFCSVDGEINGILHGCVS